jgi:secreted PhoX family phosphatase
MYWISGAVVAGHTMFEGAQKITITPYYVLTPNDVFSVNTTNYKATPGKVDVARNQIDRIMAVPNPYFAANAYETNQFGHIMRITNLPAVAKIRIFNLAGQLIRTYDKNDPNSTSFDWDLNNANALPVASGMYIIHIDMGAIGTKVLKVAVIQADERLNNL